MELESSLKGNGQCTGYWEKEHGGQLPGFELLSMAIIHEMESRENQKPVENQASFDKRQNQASLHVLRHVYFQGQYSKYLTVLR